jgi:hypothetical protein
MGVGVYIFDLNGLQNGLLLPWLFWHWRTGSCITSPYSYVFNALVLYLVLKNNCLSQALRCQF